MDNLNYIVTAKHMTKTGNPRDWLYKLRADILKQRGVSIEINEKIAGEPVTARIYHGHWIADCDVCNGAMVVDPSDPVFFCFECFNRANNGKLRPVNFPNEDERNEIEQLILARPVNDYAGLTDSDRAIRARPVVHVDNGKEIFGLLRDWEPQETVKDLKEQNKLIARWKRAKAGGR